MQMLVIQFIDINFYDLRIIEVSCTYSYKKHLA